MRAIVIQFVNGLIVSALTVHLLALPALAAEPPDLASWACAACADTGGWVFDLETGLAAVSDDAFRFGNGTGLENDGAALLGDVYTRYRNDRADYFLLDGYLRGENSIGLFARGGRQGLFELRGSYQEFPRRQYGSTVTPYRGSDAQRLPANWVAGPTSGQMATLEQSQRSEPIASELDTLKLGLTYRPASDWDVKLDYARRQEQGRARWGGSFLFNAIELAAPVDQVTNNLDASLGYSRDRWQIRMSYFGSKYENRQQRLTWQNAYSAPFGVTLGQAARAPDNQAHQLSLSGTLALPARTLAALSISRGEMTQNAALLDYSVNASLPVVPLPASTADTEVQTTLVNLRVTSSPWRKLSFEGQWRFHDHDNRSPQPVFDTIITDAAPAAIGVRSSAYDYQRDELKLRAEYRPWRPLALDLGFSTRDVKRNQQERDRTTTDRLWFELRARARGLVSVKAELLAEQRDGSEYRLLENPAAPQNPLMRKYNMADRDRTSLRLRASLLKFPQADLSVEYAATDDDYDNSGIGLTGSRSRRIGLDAGYTVNLFSAYLSVSEEEIRTEQRNSQAFAAPDWNASSDDRFSNAVINLTRRELFAAVDLEVEYSWSKSRGRIAKNTSGLMTSFPDLSQSRNTLRLGVKIPWREKISFGVDYFLEDLSSEDWALDGARPDSVPTLLALGAEAWNYRSNVIYASVNIGL